MDDLADAIEHLTDRVIIQRVLHKMFNEGKILMPIELKSLKDKALAARRHIDRLHRAYDGFNEAAPAHARDVEGIAGDVEAMTEDLTAAARILGNSEAGSGEPERPVEKPEPSDNGEQPKAPVLVSATAAAKHAASQDFAATFRGQAEAQIAAAQGAKT